MVWAPDYVTAAELKSYLRIADTADDAELALAITTASRAIDGFCHRQFGQVTAAEERSYTAYWDRRARVWVIVFDDLQDITGLTVTVEAGTVDAYTLEPVNAAQEGRPFTRLHVDPDSAAKPTTKRNDVTIDAVWGWDAVPAAVEQATLLQASRFHARRFSPYGVAGSPEQGSEMRLLAKLDPDVELALSRAKLIRWWGAV
jgi:uncharacterized phiE125 gp8 family phage protein